MIRSFSLAAALAVGMSLPALAVDTGSAPATRSLFSEVQARQHLVRLGYTNISELTKDQDGRWVGAATTKDGQTRAVAVDIKRPVAPAAAPTN